MGSRLPLESLPVASMFLATPGWEGENHGGKGTGPRPARTPGSPGRARPAQTGHRRGERAGRPALPPSDSGRYSRHLAQWRNDDERPGGAPGPGAGPHLQPLADPAGGEAFGGPRFRGPGPLSGGRGPDRPGFRRAFLLRTAPLVAQARRPTASDAAGPHPGLEARPDLL